MTPSIRRLAGTVVSAVVETVYPKVCAGCGMRGCWLCPYCETRVPHVSQPISCRRCGVPMHRNRCACADLDHVITVARSAYIYDGWAATAVKRVKYHGEPARAEHLAMLMVTEFGAFGAIDALIPVPLHPSREKQRGYNQSFLLATHLANITGVPMRDVLRRTRKTVSQTTLSGQERKQNVAGVFEVDPTWVPKIGGRYVLIDDVRTTGATLNACADALKPHMPGMVGVLTFALDMSREQIQELREYEATAAIGAFSPPGSVASGPGPSGPHRGRHRGP